MRVRVNNGLGLVAVIFVGCIDGCDRKPPPVTTSKASSALAPAASTPAPAARVGVSAAETKPSLPIDQPPRESSSPTAVAEPDIPKPRPSSAEPTTPLFDRVAIAVMKACPMADPADAAARDAAAAKLARIAELIDSPETVLGWGQYDESKGFDPTSNTLLEFEPVVWVKTYLSQFMFPGEHASRKVGDFDVVEMSAKFRSGMKDEEYAYPIWQSAAAWRAHVGAKAIMLVFKSGELKMALLKSETAGGEAGTKKWDGRWMWKDEKKKEQPRTSTFDYLVAPENPDVGGLRRAYEQLRPKLEAYNCIGCHSPDNTSGAKRLLLMTTPAMMLGARHTLVDVLREREQKTGDPHANREGGIPDHAAREALIGLAETFREAAETTIAYEQARRALD